MRVRNSSPTHVKKKRQPTNVAIRNQLSLLRRIRSELDGKLSDSDRSALTAQIREIESAYFSGDKTPSMDLSAIVNKWLGVARKGA